MPPDKRRAPPGGSRGAPLETIALGSGDRPDHTAFVDIAQLVPRPVRPDEIPELRAIYWRQAAAGFRLPAERGVILLQGGADA